MERLNTEWPTNWKIAAISNDSTHFKVYTQVIPEDESISKWTIIGHMAAFRNFQAPNLNKIITAFTNASMEESSKAKVTVLERNDASKNFWVLYKVETSDFPGDPTPESQLTYIIQGKTSLFLTFVAIKEKALSEEFVIKWTKILKNSNLVYE